MIVWHITFITCDNCGARIMVHNTGDHGVDAGTFTAYKKAVHLYNWTPHKGKAYCPPCTKALNVRMIEGVY